jgi:hypothetical protein
MRMGLTKNTHSLVSVRASKDAGHPGRVLLREAEDGDSSESGSEELGESVDIPLSVEVEREIWADETHTSQTKMAMKTSQKNLRRFFCDRTVLSRCRASKRLTWGIRLGKTCATHQYRARVDACRRQPGATYNVRGIDGERSHESSDAVSEAL